MVAGDYSRIEHIGQYALLRICMYITGQVTDATGTLENRFGREDAGRHHYGTALKYHNCGTQS